VVLIVGIHQEVYRLLTPAGEEMFTTMRPDNLSPEAAAVAALQVRPCLGPHLGPYPGPYLGPYLGP